MKHLKRFDDLILERSSLLNIGFPKDFMQYLQKTLKLKLFNPDDFRVPVGELSKEKSFKKILRDLLKSGCLVLILDDINDKYYAVYTNKDITIIYYNNGNIKTIKNNKETFREIFNEIVLFADTKKWYAVDKYYYKRTPSETKENQKDEENIREFVIYFNKNIKNILEKIFRKEWYKMKEVLIEYISQIKPENIKEIDIGRAVADFKAFTKQDIPILKMNIKDNCPISWESSWNEPNITNFINKKFGISYNTENISKLIEQVGIMKLSTMLAHYIVKAKIEKIDKFIKKYSPWFIESDKFNF